MGKNEQTTVNLSELAQKVKVDLAPVFGLKNILSAGLILFGRLTSDQQKQVIAEANGQKPMPLAVDPVKKIGEMLEGFRNSALLAQAAPKNKPSKRDAKKAGGR